MHYIGVDLGGTNIAVGLVNEKGEILAKGSIPTNAKREADEIVKDMGKLCCDICEKAGVPVSEVEYAGVATPGIANHDDGIVVYANNLPFVNYPLAAKLSKFSGIKKVLVENDANAAAKGEAEMGAAKGCNNAVMITLGTGVGGGIIINKKVYSGFNYAGGELGHVVIVSGGRKCSCGREGCWEAYSSATGLINMTRDKMLEVKDSLLWKYSPDIDDVSGKTAFIAMREGDAAAKEVVDTYLEYLGIGLTNMINIFQPEVLVIGGGICKEGDAILLPLREYCEKHQYGSTINKHRTELRIAQLGNDAGIIGAAMLGF